MAFTVGPETFAALGDETRYAIAQQLSTGPKSVGEIARAFGISPSSASQHLKVLYVAGLLEKSRQGKQTFYALNRAAAESLSHYFQTLSRDGKVAQMDDREVQKAFGKGVANWGALWPELDPITVMLSANLEVASRRLRKLYEVEADKFHLSITDVRFLGMLWLMGEPHESTPTQVSKRSMLPMPRLSHRLEHLEKAGFIARRTSGVDRRSRLIRLTPKGLEVFRKISSGYNHLVHDRYYLRLAPGEREQLAFLLWRLARVIVDTSNT